MTDMIALLSIYTWTVFAGAVAAVSLALIGAQLASRGQSTQCLVISQGCSLGATLGLAVTTLSGHDIASATGLPLLISLCFATVLYVLCEKYVPRSLPSRNTFYIGLFALLLGVTHAVTSLVPSLESHMAANFFGDLAVTSDAASKILILAGLASISVLLLYWKQITNRSFDTAIFGSQRNTRSGAMTDAIFMAATILMLGLAIQSLGFLFTVSSLFLPSLIIGLSAVGIKPFTISIALAAAIGAISGFVFSLWQESWPTVPAIALSYVLVSTIISVLIRHAFPRSQKG